MAKTLGIYDSIPGLWLMKANFLGLYFLVFFAAFKNMPAAYAEAAKVDGSRQFQDHDKRQRCRLFAPRLRPFCCSNS